MRRLNYLFLLLALAACSSKDDSSDDGDVDDQSDVGGDEGSDDEAADEGDPGEDTGDADEDTGDGPEPCLAPLPYTLFETSHGVLIRACPSSLRLASAETPLDDQGACRSRSVPIKLATKT